MSSTKRKRSQYQKKLYWHGRHSPDILSRHILLCVIPVERCTLVSLSICRVVVFSRLYPITLSTLVYIPGPAMKLGGKESNHALDPTTLIKLSFGSKNPCSSLWNRCRIHHYQDPLCPARPPQRLYRIETPIHRWAHFYAFYTRHCQLITGTHGQDAFWLSNN